MQQKYLANKITEKDHLPEINHADSRINPEERKLQSGGKKTSSYFEALRRLKDITTKLAVLRNRMHLLSFKEANQKDKSSAALSYEKKKEHLRTVSSQQNEKFRIQFENLQRQYQQQIRAKRTENYLVKQESTRKIINAKKMVTEEKERNYKSIRERSTQNQQKISLQKRNDLSSKRKKYEELYKRELEHIKIIQNIKESRIKTIKQECESQTQQILEKIKQKQMQLQKMQRICNNFYPSPTRKLQKINQGNVRKIHFSRTPLSNSKKSFVTTPTPSRAISFVIVP